MFSYPIIDIVQIEGITNSQYVVKLQNFWSELEWKGDWSKDSKLWTEKTKQQLNWHASDWE